MEPQQITCENMSPNYFPETVAPLKKLETLSLTMQRISGTLSEDFGNMTSLRTLHIHILGPDEPNFPLLDGWIPASIQNCTQLEDIAFMNTKLEGFSRSSPPSFPLLRSLSFTQNPQLFGYLDHVLLSAPNLTYLDLSDSRINIQSSDSIVALRMLEYLIVDRKPINILLDSQFWLSKQRLKYFSANASPAISTSIDPAIGTLKYLRYLDLNGTYIFGTIPEEIGQCESLEFLSVKSGLVRKPLPESLGLLSKLEHLSITHLGGLAGTLSNSLGRLKNLETLDLSDNLFIGTIPDSIALLPNLSEIILHGNELTGTIPNFLSNVAMKIDIHSNKLTGPIPPDVAENSYYLDLSNNLLGPTIPTDLFINTLIKELLDLSSNRFSGPLPDLPRSTGAASIIFSHNEFNGTIPRSFCHVPHLFLDHNHLIGTLDDLLLEPCGDTMDRLYVHNNRLNGTIPNLLLRHSLSIFVAGSNQLTGDLPQLSYTMNIFDVSNNELSINIGRWKENVARVGLRRLDLSYNRVVSPDPYNLLIGPQLQHLAIAGMTGLFSQSDVFIPPTNLISLDLSDCQLQSSFDATLYPQISSLKIGGNMFIGILELGAMSQLTQLNISHNYFNFDVAAFSRLPLLSTLHARRNHLYGTLTLADLPNLQTADFGDNYLSHAPDFASIGILFGQFVLQSLNISANPFLAPIADLDTAKTGLARSSSSSPSVFYNTSVKCYTLDFYGNTGATFYFDEPLFNYTQCDCDENHFGLPPHNCYKCPAIGVMSCGAQVLKVEENYFSMWLDGSNEGNDNGSIIATSTAINAPILAPNSIDSFTETYATESCLYKTIHLLTRKSNCQNLTVTPQLLTLHNNSIISLIKTQCKEGSTGRLCSRCICDAPETGVCYFTKGPYVASITIFSHCYSHNFKNFANN